MLQHIVAGDLARRAARDDVCEIDPEVSGELADGRLRDDADGCRDPLIGRGHGLAAPGLGMPTGAVPDEDCALAGRGRHLGGLAVLALADGRRACGRRDR
jgi:hypothetical protein